MKTNNFKKIISVVSFGSIILPSAFSISCSGDKKQDDSYVTPNMFDKTKEDCILHIQTQNQIRINSETKWIDVQEQLIKPVVVEKEKDSWQWNGKYYTNKECTKEWQNDMSIPNTDFNIFVKAVEIISTVRPRIVDKTDQSGVLSFAQPSKVNVTSETTWLSISNQIRTETNISVVDKQEEYWRWENKYYKDPECKQEWINSSSIPCKNFNIYVKAFIITNWVKPIIEDRTGETKQLFDIAPATDTIPITINTKWKDIKDIDAYGFNKVKISSSQNKYWKWNEKFYFNEECTDEINDEDLIWYKVDDPKFYIKAELKNYTITPEITDATDTKHDIFDFKSQEEITYTEKTKWSDIKWKIKNPSIKDDMKEKWSWDNNVYYTDSSCEKPWIDSMLISSQIDSGAGFYIKANPISQIFKPIIIDTTKDHVFWIPKQTPIIVDDNTTWGYIKQKSQFANVNIAQEYSEYWQWGCEFYHDAQCNNPWDENESILGEDKTEFYVSAEMKNITFVPQINDMTGYVKDMFNISMKQINVNIKTKWKDIKTSSPFSDVSLIESNKEFWQWDGKFYKDTKCSQEWADNDDIVLSAGHMFYVKADAIEIPSIDVIATGSDKADKYEVFLTKSRDNYIEKITAKTIFGDIKTNLRTPAYKDSVKSFKWDGKFYFDKQCTKVIDDSCLLTPLLEKDEKDEYILNVYVTANFMWDSFADPDNNGKIDSMSNWAILTAALDKGISEEEIKQSIAESRFNTTGSKKFSWQIEATAMIALAGQGLYNNNHYRVRLVDINKDVIYNDEDKSKHLENSPILTWEFLTVLSGQGEKDVGEPLYVNCIDQKDHSQTADVIYDFRDSHIYRNYDSRIQSSESIKWYKSGGSKLAETTYYGMEQMIKTCEDREDDDYYDHYQLDLDRHIPKIDRSSNISIDGSGKRFESTSYNRGVRAFIPTVDNYVPEEWAERSSRSKEDEQKGWYGSYVNECHGQYSFYKSNIVDPISTSFFNTQLLTRYSIHGDPYPVYLSSPVLEYNTTLDRSLAWFWFCMRYDDLKKAASLTYTWADTYYCLAPCFCVTGMNPIS